MFGCFQRLGSRAEVERKTFSQFIIDNLEGLRDGCDAMRNEEQTAKRLLLVPRRRV